MALAGHTPLVLLVAATMAALAVSVSGGATAAEMMMSSAIHARVAAEWAAWSAAGAPSSDDSCWGSPEECPVVYDVDAEGGGGGGATQMRGRMGLQLYYDVNAVASLLPTAQFISYSALRPDTVPCSVPGASYYNCQPGADANPYARGCSAITQCRD